MKTDVEILGLLGFSNAETVPSDTPVRSIRTDDVQAYIEEVVESLFNDEFNDDFLPISYLVMGEAKFLKAAFAASEQCDWFVDEGKRYIYSVN